jgi:D-alanine-D-alanine ligase
VFVKPANLGSSVGVTKAGGPAALAEAVEVARGYDEWVLVEEAVTARELEVGVLGNAELEASVVGEIIPSREFYDYEDKYLEGAARMVIPADVPSRTVP